MFGFSVGDSGPLRKLFAIAQAVLQGKANWTAFAVGVGTLAVILLLKGRKRVPGILIAVVGATAVVEQLVAYSCGRGGRRKEPVDWGRRCNKRRLAASLLFLK